MDEECLMRAGWRRIESAPKDGRPFAAWFQGLPDWVRCDGWSDTERRFRMGSLMQPTHWFPVPNPDVHS